MDFCRFMLDYCHLYTEKNPGKALFLCGDVNIAHKEIDLARPKENADHSGFLPEERAWLDDFLAAGFIDTFRLFHHEGERYTWWDMKTRARERNIGWRIDYFFGDIPHRDMILAADISAQTEGSDHCPVSLRIALPPA
jgi:exodeoxyribonuclease-3